MICYCDYYKCQNLATHTYMNGMLKLCDKHKTYYTFLKPRMMNLKLNSGRGRTQNEINYFKKLY